MYNAKEAKEQAMKNNIFNREKEIVEQFDYICSKIHEAITKGQFHFSYLLLVYEENIRILSKLGYKIEVEETNKTLAPFVSSITISRISWE